MIIFKTFIEYSDLWSKIYKVPIIFSTTELTDKNCFEIHRSSPLHKEKIIYVYVPKLLHPFIDADVVIMNPRKCGKISSMTNFENDEHFHSVIKKELSKAFYKELLNEPAICTSVWRCSSGNRSLWAV